MNHKPFHVSSLAMVLFGLSSMLDSGDCDDITLEDVKSRARNGTLLDYLKERGGDTMTTGLLERNEEFAAWYAAQILENIETMDGEERRKYGIQNRYLCLLISYTAEIIQHGKGFSLS